MAYESVELNPGTGGAKAAVDTLPGGIVAQVVKIDVGADGASNPVVGSLPVNDGGGSLTVDDGGGSITVDGTVAVSGSVAVTGPLTDTQLRANAVPVSAAALPLPAGAATSTPRHGGARHVTTDATISAIARKLGEYGWSVIRTDDLAELRLRAHIGDTHRAFRRDAIDTISRIRHGTTPTTTRFSHYRMARDAYQLADAFLRRTAQHEDDATDARP